MSSEEKDEFRLDGNFLHSERAMPRRPEGWPDPIHGSARWADEGDLEPFLGDPGPHGTLLPEASPLVQGTVGGGRAPARGEGAPGGPIAPGALRPLYLRGLGIPEDLRNCHLLGVGQPGCGKTTKLVLPVLASDLRDPERSVVIFDAKGNLYPFVRALMDEHRPGRDPIVLNLTDPARSVGWNPVRRDMDEQTLQDVAHQVCHSAETRAGDSELPFWLNNSIKVLFGILRGLQDDPAEDLTLARARELLHLPSREFAAWIEKHDPTGMLADFHGFHSSGSHNAATILSDCQMRLTPWLDPALRAVTGHAELDLDDLVAEPTVLLVEMEEARIPKLRPIWNLLCEQLFAHFLNSSLAGPGGRLPRPVSVLMDEFASSIGRIPDMQVRLNTLRERRVSILAAVQSLSQLQAVYGTDADAVLSAFASKVFFPRLELADARYASSNSGDTTVASQTWSTDAMSGVDEPARSVQWQPVRRPLLLPDEVQHPPAHFLLGQPATLFLVDTPPFQAWLRPAHELDELRSARLAARAVEGRGRQLRSRPLVWGADGARGVPGGRPLDPALVRRPRPVLAGGIDRPPGAGGTELRPFWPGYEALDTGRRVQGLLLRLGWAEARPDVRRWWRRFEERHRDEPRRVVGLAEALYHRRAGLEQFHAAVQRSKARGIEANLCFFDYLRLSEEEDTAGVG